MSALYYSASRFGSRRLGYSISYNSLSSVRALLLPKTTTTSTATTRTFSSYKFEDSTSPSSLIDERSERKWTLLYHRNPSRSTSPRALFGMSTFNLLYWTWYVIDFTPAINTAAQIKADMGQIDTQTLELLLVDPIMGYVGLGVSMTIWLGAYYYSKQLVSAIWGTHHHTTTTNAGITTNNNADDGDEKEEKESEEVLLAVSTLKLPFLIQPKVLRKLVYNPETNNYDGGAEVVQFTESEIMSTGASLYSPDQLVLSEEQKRQDVIVKFDGDFSRLRGFVALKKCNGDDSDDNNRGPLASVLQQKYLVDINSADEVMPNASPFLMRALVLSDYPFDSSKKSSVMKKRKTGRQSSSEKQRPISQLEMDRLRRKQ
jgi:hypothetical protein